MPGVSSPELCKAWDACFACGVGTSPESWVITYKCACDCLCVSQAGRQTDRERGNMTVHLQA